MDRDRVRVMDRSVFVYAYDDRGSIEDFIYHVLARRSRDHKALCGVEMVYAHTRYLEDEPLRPENVCGDCTTEAAREQELLL